MKLSGDDPLIQRLLAFGQTHHFTAHRDKNGGYTFALTIVSGLDASVIYQPPSGEGQQDPLLPLDGRRPLLRFMLIDTRGHQMDLRSIDVQWSTVRVR